MGRPGAGSGPSAGFAVRRVPRKSRRKLIVRAILAVCGLGLLLGGSWWLATSPTFAVSQVESGSYRFTAQADLENVFASFLGRNIWSLSTSAVADSLGSLPWVKDLQVRRRLPGALAVDFREWRPLLIIEPDRKGEKPHVLVEDGRVLPFPEHLVLPGLPVLVGVGWDTDPDTGIPSLVPEHRDLVLQLVAAVEQTGLETACPIDFIVARQEGFGIVLQEGKGSLLVGREDFVSRLDRYMAARDHLEPGLQMDLRFADKITCRRI